MADCDLINSTFFLHFYKFPTVTWAIGKNVVAMECVTLA